ncbi:hypothetical protein ISF_04206 [Cordyceps fumosorosea ARSEF 2679]|uniref:Uncharacterized protein n=1 Tax=Cordyceps fumosorosea (strain ARSEF 2679) TaxID=1081104 RepID=A0A167XCA8_CORFA|nr:hypothetical protein ISF_04206 [Cordyceps fumosorosea ARSEF 2679]OAA64796.1 hypothetical protein ISF_04206 [Cordyceps fumosorosea ARSEF 2679]
MAAVPLSNSPSKLFDVYTDNAPNRNLSPMPRGGCNFVDLTPGTAGSRCGCRRFWKLHATDNIAPGQAGWCMCNHHACYHDERAPDEPRALAPPTPVLGQENEKPKPTGREPLSPVIDFAFKVPPSIPGLDMANLSAGPPPPSFLNNPPDDMEMMTAPNMPPPAAPPAAPSIPDTLNWGDFINSDNEQGVAPHIPPQFLFSQKTASTTSSLQNKYLRPFAGKGLHTLATRKDPTQSPLRQTSRSKSQVTQTALVRAEQPPGTPVTVASTIVEPRALERNPASREGFKNLTDALSGHEQRLDKLETGSFAAVAAHDDCVDKHEHLDLRITDLEGKVEELEKFTNDNDTVVSRRERNDDDGATASIISATTSINTRPANAREFANQLQALQSQVSQLHSFLPSINNPWEVEVVFLPFPLKKVWQDIHQFKQDPTISNDDWTQLPQTNSASMFRSQSPVFGDWATADHDAEWLLPKACGDKSVTDKRLRSRGLVKTISVHGPDARSVHMAVVSAFGSVFNEMQMLPRRQDTDPRYGGFIGLHSSWLPLRKIHRDSRLRFLSPAEMVTPALWDVQFLSSVMMRSSEPRLFITHPDAYLQDYVAYEAGWTWQRVRELTRVYADIDESQQVPEADALEEHWTWSETMDEPPNVNTSMSLRQSRQRTTMSPSHARFPLIERWRSQSPAVIREHTPMTNLNRSAGSRSSSRQPPPPHGRTASVPVAAARHPSFDNQRRVSMNSRRASPAMRVAVSGGIMKNGRGTRSPSHPLYTPRWTHSPSPVPWGGPQDRQPTRGITPFAYATPYSNAAAPQQPENGYRARSGSVVRFEVDQPFYRPRGSSSRPVAGPPMTMVIDDDDDVKIYNSESDEDYADDDDGDTTSVDMATDAQPRPLQPITGSGWPGMPEDEPWPGLEDRGAPLQRSADAENIDPNSSGERPESQQSSQPSEYPSTQVIKRDEDEDDDFLIHED